MPEVAEAATIADKLAVVLKGKQLVTVACSEKAKQTDMDKLYHPCRVTWIGSYGKKVLMLTEHNQLIVTLLGMSGKWLWEQGDHSHLSLTFQVDDKEVSIYFDQPRPFGSVEMLPCGDSVTKAVRQRYRMGPDILREPPTVEEWVSIFRGTTLVREGVTYGVGKKVRNWMIGRTLMEQEMVAGIGNWLKSEILFDARIRPDRVVSTLTDAELHTLYHAAIKVVNDAYAHGGLTIKDCWSPDGSKGVYPAKVYGQKTVVVDGIEYPVITTQYTDKRTCHWVEQLQM